jgi:hypothetical protein
MHHVKIFPMIGVYFNSYGALLNTNNIIENKLI